MWGPKQESCICIVGFPACGCQNKENTKYCCTPYSLSTLPSKLHTSRSHTATSLAPNFWKEYKTAACMCYNIITGFAPSYLSELLHLYSPSCSLCSLSDVHMHAQIPMFQPQNLWLLHFGITGQLRVTYFGKNDSWDWGGKFLGTIFRPGHPH